MAPRVTGCALGQPPGGGPVLVPSHSSLGYVSFCVQNRLRKTSGHGKRLIVWIDLLTKEHSHDHSSQA